jgi:hypothetical protein
MGTVQRTSNRLWQPEPAEVEDRDAGAGGLEPEYVEERREQIPREVLVHNGVGARAAEFASLDDRGGRLLGMITAGPSAHEAQVVASIYHHTIPVLERAEDHLGGLRCAAAGATL